MGEPHEAHNDMDDKLDLLRIHRSTRGLDETQIQLLADHAEVVSCHEGDMVHRAEEATDALFLVVSGRLTMSAISARGAITVIRQVGRDDQFGLLTLECEEPFPIQVTAAHNTTLLRIEKDDAVRLVLELPLWRRNMMRSVGSQLIDSILKEKQRTNRRVIALFHMTEDSRKLTSALLKRMSQLGEKVGLVSDQAPADETQVWKYTPLVDELGQLHTMEVIRARLSRWQAADRIVVESSIDRVAAHIEQLTDAADNLFWICSDETVDHLTALLQAIVGNSPARRNKLFVIRMLADSEQAASWAPQLDKLCQQDFKLHWNGDLESPTCSRRAGIERIVHYLRGVSIGLAMGGGAARGMAHLGVLQVIEQAGIVIDRMSGTSAGALTGVLYAAGHTADFQIDAFARDLEPESFYRWLPYGDGLYMLRKYRRGLWDDMLRKYLQHWRLEQLAIPFSAVSADLVGAKQVIRTTGDAATAILESINLPGLSRPICRDGMALVDGGVLNVMPADILVEQDANFVIASDVSARIRFEFAGNRPDTPTEKMTIPSTAETVVRMRTVQDRNLRSIGGSAADIIIEPDVSQVELTDFKRARKIAEYGRSAASEMLPEILQALHQLDEQLFPSNA